MLNILERLVFGHMFEMRFLKLIFSNKFYWSENNCSLLTAL